MSIRFPGVNDANGGNACARLTLPTAACSKPAFTGCVTLFWMEWPYGFASNAGHNVITKQTGLLGNTGGRIGAVASVSPTALNFILWAQSSAIFADTGVTGLVPGARYLVMLISTAANIHCICAPVSGAAPLRTSIANTSFHDLVFSSGTTGRTTVWDGIGGGTGSSLRGWVGPVEDFNFYHGLFPETAGVPDETLIANIATGAQSVTTLHSLLTGGAHRCRYRLSDPSDRSDLVGGNTAATVVNDDPDNGRRIYSYGPLQPVTFTPDFAVDMVSNCLFSTPGDVATAKTTIRTVGGAYSGMTPLRIEARLMKEDMTVLSGFDWRTVDAAPAAGRWAIKTDAFVDVPMTVGFLQMQFRAIALDGTTVLATNFAYDLTGAGFSFMVDGQSQITRLMLLGGSAAGRQLSSGSRAIGMYNAQTDFTNVLPRREIIGRLSLASTVRDTAGGGVRSAFLEFNAKFPGIPVQWTMIGQEGTPIQGVYSVFGGDSSKYYLWRWASQKAACGGQLQPFGMVYFGHSSDADTTYSAKLALAVAYVEAQMGVSQYNVHIPVSRLGNAVGADEQNTGVQANTVWVSREQARAYCAANPTRNKYFGNLSTVLSFSEPTPGTEDPHAKTDSDTGDGRTGSTMALAIMAMNRAITDEPLTLTSVRAVGAVDVLEFGRVNPF